MRLPKTWIDRATILLGLTVLCSACGRVQVVEDVLDGATIVESQEVRGELSELPSPPAYPRDGALLPVDLGPVSSFRFYIDRDSIVVRPGGIVRFTLLARSFSGATNVSFEAIRCSTRERRPYALALRPGEWTTARASQWQSLDAGTASRPYLALANQFFCPNGLAAQSNAEIIDALQLGRHPATDPAPVR
jgi:hypothetical protein